MENIYKALAEQIPGTEVPSYLYAGDNHNIGNNLDVSKSWLDPQKYIEGADSAWKFIKVSALSGADGMYNTGVVVNNIFGGDAKLSDTGAWISSIDRDLGQYYGENREWADLAGFIGSSLIPGLAGIKLLNAGQLAIKGAVSSGYIGGNLAKATGLLVPETQMYVNLAAREVIASQATFSAINTNTVRALGAGFHQNVLEGAAFEIAVQATMFKSPILENQTIGDVIKHIAIGGLFAGTIGGAFEAARTFGTIKKQVLASNPEAKMFSSRAQIADATPESQRIILNAEDRELTAIPISLRNQAGEEVNNFARNQKLYESKIARVNNEIRASTNAMAVEKDLAVTNLTADVTYMFPSSNMVNLFLHADDIGRLSSTLKAEVVAKKAIADLDTAALLGTDVRYLKLTGEGRGSTLDAAPVVANIADRVATSGGKSLQDAVMGYARAFKFKPGDEWSASSLSAKSNAHLEAEARYIIAQHSTQTIKPGTKIQYDDFPMLEKAYKDKTFDFKLINKDGSVGAIGGEAELLNHLTTTKFNTANELLEKWVLEGSTLVEEGTARIAKIVNMREGALSGSPNTLNVDDFFAMQTANLAHKQALVASGARTATEEIQNIAFLPSVAKIGYKIPEEFQNLNGTVLDGLVWLKTQQKLFQDAADNVFAKNVGDDILANAAPISDSALQGASQIGESGGLISFANAAYGRIGSIMQQIGANVTRPLKEKLRKETADAFNGPLVAMGNKQQAAIEFEVVNQRIANTSELYVLDRTGAITGTANSLVAKKIADAHATGKPLTTPLQAGAPEFIEVKNLETFNAIAAHVQRNDDRLIATKEIRSVQGHSDNKTLGVFTPVRPRPDDYPFIAFVKDVRVSGAGHTSMIHAASEKELQELISKVPPQYKTYLKKDAEDFYRARGEYDYARTLNTNYVDHDLINRGINSQFFPKSDPQKIVDGILQEHLRHDDVLAAELVRMKYQPQFSWLEDQGSQYSRLEASRYGNALTQAEKFGKNPYTDLIKTALDVSRASEYPLLYSFNKSLDSAVSKVVANVKNVFNSAKTPQELEQINNILRDAGYNNAYPDAATVLLANHTAPKAELSKFVRTSNSILSFFTLGLDPLNALNNTIGATILRGTETTQLLRAIKAGDPAIAGELSKLSLNLPGTGDQILSGAKLIANANKAFFSAESDELIKTFVKAGTVKDGLQQFRQIQDDFTLRGTESVAELDSRIKSAWGRAQELSGKIAAGGRKWSGNEYAEQYNRFISSHVMKQLTDLAEAGGHLTPQESRAYWNTFVNRVEGNIVASQRPIIFQGPIGQAIGLFQSYQFNLMQQLFRYVGEGTGKDAAMLLGLQGTMYGLNGQPGFHFVNEHIVGNMSGNKNHTDLYDIVYGIAGRQAGDFFVYGIPSSIIQTNLYSRGDINPRQITIIPNTLNQIPIVGAYGKVFSNMHGVAMKLGNGGDVWETLLQGIEHNGISRPLAGIAQVAQAAGPEGKVYSTSTKGTILFSNDLFSLASLSRIVGGRPMDEAILNDGVYRITAYEAARKKQKQRLDESIKSSTIAGNAPSESQVELFAEKYAATGGKQAQFNSYMMKQMVSSNTSRAEDIKSQLSSPFSVKMQLLMGGTE